MRDKKKVLKRIQNLERDEFEDFCLTCIERLGIKILNFKAMKDNIIAEGTLKREDKDRDYVIEVTLSADKSRLDELRGSLSPSKRGLFITTDMINDDFSSYENIETVGGEKLYRLVKKFGLVSKYDLLTEEDPSESLRDKGRFFLRKDQYEKAAEVLERAVDVDGDNVEGQILLGKAYDLQGQKEEALEAYERAAELRPKDVEILKKKGRLLYESGRYDEAILCFEDILDEHPKSKEAWNNKALCHMRNSEYDESLESIERALSIDPTFEDALLNRALILENIGEIERAVRAVDNLLEEVPEKAEYHYFRAAYLESLNRYNESRKSIEKALRLDPKHERARRLKSRL